MKLISWNVNGLRAVIKKGFYDFIKEFKPDILCLQEIKANKEQVELELPDYNYKYWNSADKKGYSGTAIFSKVRPINVIYDIDIKKHNSEGRVITLEFEDYFLVTIPSNIWNGFKGLDNDESIIANCLDMPHNENEMVRIDPFDKTIKYNWK